jgi:uncharacterized membrane protein YkvA (DUF1232 family)
VNVTKNRFFRLAINRAAKLAGKPGRILSLLAQLAVKLSQTKNSITANAIREHSMLIGRMVKAHVTGAYRIKSMRIFIILLAAIIYFINPIDLIPDFIFGIGLTDDLAVLTWVYRAAAEEIASFRNYENSIRNPEPAG